MPEPEFFIVLFATGVIFMICCGIAVGLYFLRRRKDSKVLKILAIISLIPGLLAFVPMFILLLMWVWHWKFGNKTTTGAPWQFGHHPAPQTTCHWNFIFPSE